MASLPHVAILLSAALFSCGSRRAPAQGVAAAPRQAGSTDTALAPAEPARARPRSIAENERLAVVVEADTTALVERASGRRLAAVPGRHEDCTFARADLALCVRATGEPQRGLAALAADGTARSVDASADEPPSVAANVVHWVGRTAGDVESSLFALDLTTGDLARYQPPDGRIAEFEPAPDGTRVAIALDDRVVVASRAGARFDARELPAERPEGLVWEEGARAVAWGESDLEHVARLRVADAATGRVVELRVPPCPIAVEIPTRFAGGRLVTDATCSPGCPSLPYESIERSYRVGATLTREGERRAVIPAQAAYGPYE